MNRILAPVLLLAGSLIPIGCGDDSADCDPACSAGFTCDDGLCIMDQAPVCDPACGIGAVCVNGQCISESPGQCIPACSGGAICQDGKCALDTSGQCNPPCQDGLECINGQCMTSEACDPACEAGFTCVLGQCSKDQPPQCDPACQAGSNCVDGQCVPVARGDCKPQGNIANLASCAEGPVDVTVKGATVTYVFEKGYFIQDASDATEVYVGDEWPYQAPEVGQVINLHATEYGSYKGQQEIVASEAPVMTGSGNADALKTDISNGLKPSEDLESYIVMGVGLKVDGADGKDLDISYGNAAGVILRVANAGDLCVGATFDLGAAIVTQWDDFHRLQSFKDSDVGNVNTSGCGGSSDADDSNWDFEEGGQNDPPADFEKVGNDLTANWTDAQASGGSQSCQLTWTSQDNQDLYQAWFMPASGGQQVDYTLYVLDEDDGGRARLCLEFYDGSFVSVGKEYSGGYSSTGPGWVKLEYSKAAPAGTAFVRGFVRMYDETSGWDGSATLFIDDWDVLVK